ncbi:MAG TPA: DnaB-like helicase N-terminal domain-containing protein, partial [Pseudoxanthomonas sp.]|nr:DnaB-like helicase N-terminal domain-containing protein [Pseudoxanthomonas sp.]
MSARPGFRNDRSDARVEQLRVPPHSVEAEQAVLGGLMLAPEAYDTVGD